MSISLEKAAGGFKLSNQASTRAPKTVQWYESNLNNFRKWLDANSYATNLNDLTPDILREHLVSLQTESPRYLGHPFKNAVTQPLAARTVHARYRSLAVFFNWAVREGLIDQSPLSNTARPKVPRTFPKPFTENEVQRLLKACEAEPNAGQIREKAIILFLLDTGVRRGELLTLGIDNLRLEQGQALITGKGTKQRQVYFASHTRKALWRYITLVRPEPKPTINNLFLSQAGEPMTGGRLAFLMKRLGAWGHVEDVHPHRFRRTAAIQFLRNGGNLFALQKMLGHETLEMVRRYVELADADLEQAHKTASPVDNWKLH